MHDTVVKIRKRIQVRGFLDGLSVVASNRLQGGGLSKALAEPLSAQLESAARGAVRWLRAVDELVAQTDDGDDRDTQAGEVIFASRQLHVIFSELVGFLERAEDNLSDRDEVTHQETGYEREVAPFSRMESTRALREFLAERGGFTPRLAGEGGQVQADLLKLVYLVERLRDGNPKTADLYAMVVELLLDVRRHLLPAFREESHFLRGLEGLGAKTS